MCFLLVELIYATLFYSWLNAAAVEEELAEAAFGKRETKEIT